MCYVGAKCTKLWQLVELLAQNNRIHQMKLSYVSIRLIWKKKWDPFQKLHLQNGQPGIEKSIRFQHQCNPTVKFAKELTWTSWIAKSWKTNRKVENFSRYKLDGFCLCDCSPTVCKSTANINSFSRALSTDSAHYIFVQGTNRQPLRWLRVAMWAHFIITLLGRLKTRFFRWTIHSSQWRVSCDWFKCWRIWIHINVILCARQQEKHQQRIKTNHLLTWPWAAKVWVVDFLFMHFMWEETFGFDTFPLSWNDMHTTSIWCYCVSQQAKGKSSLTNSRQLFLTAWNVNKHLNSVYQCWQVNQKWNVYFIDFYHSMWIPIEIQLRVLFVFFFTRFSFHFHHKKKQPDIPLMTCTYTQNKMYTFNVKEANIRKQKCKWI